MEACGWNKPGDLYSCSSGWITQVTCTAAALARPCPDAIFGTGKLPRSTQSSGCPCLSRLQGPGGRVPSASSQGSVSHPCPRGSEDLCCTAMVLGGVSESLFALQPLPTLELLALTEVATSISSVLGCISWARFLFGFVLTSSCG